MEGLSDIMKSPESVPGSIYTFNKINKKAGNPKIPFECSATDFDCAYNSYVGWCLENNIQPLAREDLSINSLSVKKEAV